MALSTYLDIVNDVMVRLREPTVTTVSQTSLSTLVGKFVNDAKRQICDAYDWDAFNQVVTVTTVADQVGSYSLTNAGRRFKIMDVINSTNYYQLTPLSHADHDNFYYTVPTPIKDLPMYYTMQGVDSNGDTQIKFWPVPDKVYSIRFSLIVPEEDFVSDSDTTKLSKEPIVLNAFARALVERGEDGGLSSSEAYALARAAMSDLISLELARSPENDSFEAV
jgi:hypothetical protein